MENNRYALCKVMVRDICDEQGVDIGTACAILRDKMGWHFKDGKDHEITEFCSFVNDMPAEDRKAYFYGE